MFKDLSVEDCWAWGKKLVVSRTQTPKSSTLRALGLLRALKRGFGILEVLNS